MPYKIKGNCIYRKDTGKKVGCTKGDVKKYLAALHANVKEENSMTEKLERLIRRIVVEEKYKLSKGSASTKNSFGNDNLKDVNSNPRQEFEDYPISYEEGMEKLKRIKDKDKLDREYEKVFTQMNNSHERNLFRGYYKILRDNLNQKR